MPDLRNLNSNYTLTAKDPKQQGLKGLWGSTLGAYTLGYSRATDFGSGFPLTRGGLHSGGLHSGGLHSGGLLSGNRFGSWHRACLSVKKSYEKPFNVNVV